jgi:hypothetical protein
MASSSASISDILTQTSLAPTSPVSAFTRTQRDFCHNFRVADKNYPPTTNRRAQPTTCVTQVVRRAD